MQYHISEQVHGRQWEDEQQSVLDDIRRRAQHDLEAQNPGGTVTIDHIQHAVRRKSAAPGPDHNAESYLIEFTVDYTVSGQTNTFAS